MRYAHVLVLSLVATPTLSTLFASTTARADDPESSASVALQSGLAALRENADAVGLEHLAATAAMSASTEVLPAAPGVGSTGDAHGGVLLTPAR